MSAWRWLTLTLIVAFALALYRDHLAGGGGPAGKPTTPAALRSLGWREVEGLRRAAGALWGAPGVEAAAAAYASELAGSGRAPARLCSQRCEVVFDVFDDGDEAECHGAEAAALHAARDRPDRSKHTHR